MLKFLERFSRETKEMTAMLGGATAITTAVCVGLVAVGASATMVFPALAIAVGVVAGSALIAGGGTKLVKEFRHGKDEVTWENALGQTIKSTLLQKMDLEYAQNSIKHFTSDVSGRPSEKEAVSVTEQFQSVAAKVSVIKDVENGNGQFRFARSSVAPFLPQ